MAVVKKTPCRLLFPQNYWSLHVLCLQHILIRVAVIIIIVMMAIVNVIPCRSVIKSISLNNDYVRALISFMSCIIDAILSSCLTRCVFAFIRGCSPLGLYTNCTCLCSSVSKISSKNSLSQVPFKVAVTSLASSIAMSRYMLELPLSSRRNVCFVVRIQNSWGT